MGALPRIGVIGGNGWLGSAIVEALLERQRTSPDRLVLSYRSGTPTRFAGSRWTRDNQDLVDSVDVVIVSIRPQDWPDLKLHAEGKLAISVMAGVQLAQLASGLGTRRIIRSLPNAAAEVRRSFTPWIASAGVTDADRDIVRTIFECCGESAEVPTEQDIDYFTGLTGSGPAFPALLATAMIEHAVGEGIDTEVARRAVVGLLVGTGHLFEKRGDDPAALVEAFLDYRGTTAAAIETMRDRGFTGAVGDGLAAALAKSIAMGQPAEASSNS